MTERQYSCPSCARVVRPHAEQDVQALCTACGTLFDVGVAATEVTLPAAVAAAVPAETLPPRDPALETWTRVEHPFSQELLERYQMVRLLGRGGMGAVYLMRQLGLGRLVAVKSVRDGELGPAEKQLLLKEARVLASLNHPAIVVIHDAGLDGAIPYLVCEYVEGEPLDQRLGRRPPLTLPEAIRIAVAVLDGLRSAHEQGIVHRDLKPGNIFLTTAGKPKIGDFGLAKNQVLASGLSVDRLLGTPPYMSPEQCQGRPATPASDLYSVGIMFHEMVTGQRPFPGPGLADFLHQHTSAPPPAVRASRPDLPEGVDRVLGRALAKDPADRFRDAGQFSAALLEVYRDLATTPEGVSAPLAAEITLPARGDPVERPVVASVDAGAVTPPPGARGGLAALVIAGLLGAMLLAVAIPRSTGVAPVRAVPPAAEVTALRDVTGSWINKKDNGILFVTQAGDAVTGTTIGGRNFEFVRLKVDMRREGDHFAGTFAAAEGSIPSTGTCELKPLASGECQWHFKGTFQTYIGAVQYEGSSTLTRQ